jgi:hypothetical protein
MKRLFPVFMAIVAVSIAGGLLLAQSDLHVGTWKLNLAKSKYDPGPPPQSQTRTWDASGKVSVEGVNAAGKPIAYGYTVKTDGKGYATTGAIPNGADTVTTKRIDAYTFAATFTKGGEQVETATLGVSKDGKVLTLMGKGVDASGKPFNNVLVYDRQ